MVADQTESTITDLIPQGMISADTRLVLTNATYFHRVWAKPFNKDLTRGENFHVKAAETAGVPMMHRWDRWGGSRYAAIDDLQILELPYGDGSLSMVMLLPKQLDELADLEAEPTFEYLRRWMESMKPGGAVKIWLPRFKTTSQFQLNRTLQAMGMESAFDRDTADFSDMTDSVDLSISAVIHKAFVDVNKEGTEAAAATGAGGLPAGAPSEPKAPPIFRADHPFVFMIRDNRTRAILFLGNITNPLE